MITLQNTTAKHCGKPHSLQPLTVMRPPNVPPYIPVSELTGVRFLVAYWLEVCISHGTFSRYQVTREVQAMLQSKVVAQAEAIAVGVGFCIYMWVGICKCFFLYVGVCRWYFFMWVGVCRCGCVGVMLYAPAPPATPHPHPHPHTHTPTPSTQALRALYNTRLYIPDLETQLAHHLHIVKGLPEELLDPAMARQLYVFVMCLCVLIVEGCICVDERGVYACTSVRMYYMHTIINTILHIIP